MQPLRGGDVDSHGKERQVRGQRGGQTRPTMTDVARIAGVSQSSVSLVLNQMTGARISAETRSKVREAALKIGYKLPAERHQIFRDVPTARTKIAFVVDEISTSPHPVISLDGARDYAFEQGLVVFAHATRSNPQLEEAIFGNSARRSSYCRGHLCDDLYAQGAGAGSP
jgi:LacI family transcriptional regulator